ncbi:MAG: hypothetical protein GY937_04605 [bacterium]|nr:hypothetical protein [bacterium]
MKRSSFLAVLLFATLLLAPLVGGAQAEDGTLDDGVDFFELQGVPDDLRAPWREFLEGWSAFASPLFLLQELVSLALAAGLAAAIAFHPRGGRRAIDPLAWERRHAVVIYAVVGAVVAEFVLFNPPMAFVIFGIGGLMRFRSVVGGPDDTARTILAVVVGLACGLKFFPLAILATAFYWVGIWFGRSKVAYRLEVRRIPEERGREAAAAWKRALEASGCSVSHLPDPGQGTARGAGTGSGRRRAGQAGAGARPPRRSARPCDVVDRLVPCIDQRRKCCHAKHCVPRSQSVLAVSRADSWGPYVEEAVSD